MRDTYLMRNICIFGASITWGGNDLEKGGWVNRMRLWLDEKTNYETEVYNLGVPGDTTANLLARFEVEAKVREPELIIFSIGLNDSAYDKEKGINQVPIENFANNIRVLLEKAGAISKNIVFLGLSRVDESKMNPIPWRPNIYYKNGNILIYDNELKKLGASGVLYLDLANLLKPEDLDDGLHPNAAGHEKLFQVVKLFLEINKLL